MKVFKVYLLLVFVATFFFDSMAQQTAGLMLGTYIPVTIQNTISSRNEDPVTAIVSQDVIDFNGNKLITSGTPVHLSVNRTRGKAKGKPGSIEITVVSTSSVDNQIIELEGDYSVKGDTRESMAKTLTCVGCFVIFPFNFLFLLIQGESAVISGDTKITNARVASSYKINVGSDGIINADQSQDDIRDKTMYRGGGDPLKGLNISKAKEMVIGDYYALIIGIDKYSGYWKPLKNAVHDAKAVENLLKSKYKFDYFKTLYDEQATRKTVIREMEWLVANVTEKDNVFIYYSGHGQFKKELNKGYWVPADATSNSTSEYVSNNDIQTFLGGIKANHTLLVSDACFSGDIFRGSTVSVPFEDSEKYYKQVHALMSRQALTSGGIEPVMDGGRDGHSVFAYYLLKTLRNNDDKYFDATQLYGNIKIPVINNSNQSPEFNSIKNTGDEGGQFIFIKK